MVSEKNRAKNYGIFHIMPTSELDYFQTVIKIALQLLNVKDRGHYVTGKYQNRTNK